MECNKCNEEQPVSNYESDRKTCKSCRSIYFKSRNKIKSAQDRIRYYETPIKTLWGNAKKRAKRRGLDFSITLDYLKDIYQQQNMVCALSDIPFDLENNPASSFRPSLDRIDSNKGYTKDNVRIICWALNRGLGADGLDRYLQIAKAVINKMEVVL